MNKKGFFIFGDTIMILIFVLVVVLAFIVAVLFVSSVKDDIKAGITATDYRTVTIMFLNQQTEFYDANTNKYSDMTIVELTQLLCEEQVRKKYSVAQTSKNSFYKKFNEEAELFFRNSYSFEGSNPNFWLEIYTDKKPVVCNIKMQVRHSLKTDKFDFEQHAIVLPMKNEGEIRILGYPLPVESGLINLEG